MHELSIALSIRDIAEEEVKKVSAQKVERILLEIGELSGVEYDSLEFVWDAAVKNSVLENAEKEILKIKREAECLDCQASFDTDQFFATCPECKSMVTQLVHGRELKVKSMTLI